MCLSFAVGRTKGEDVMKKRFVLLSGLSSFQDVSLLALRLLTGGFLVWGVWDNITDPARMEEFIAFMRASGFSAPALLAPFTVWAQFICGLLLMVGALTRWAGLIMTINFLVALVMVHLQDNFRTQFPALILIAVNFHFALAGAGRFSVDRLIGNREAQA